MHSLLRFFFLHSPRYVQELLKMKDTFINPLLHPFSTNPSTPNMNYDYLRSDSPAESTDHLPPRFMSPTPTNTLPTDLPIVLLSRKTSVERLTFHFRPDLIIHLLVLATLLPILSAAHPPSQNERETTVRDRPLWLQSVELPSSRDPRCSRSSRRTSIMVILLEVRWPLKVCKLLQKLKENASKKGETSLAISLSKPFQRLLKYPLLRLFQNLLFHIDPSTLEYE